MLSSSVTNKTYMGLGFLVVKLGVPNLSSASTPSLRAYLRRIVFRQGSTCNVFGTQILEGPKIQK